MEKRHAGLCLANHRDKRVEAPTRARHTLDHTNQRESLHGNRAQRISRFLIGASITP